MQQGARVVAGASAASPPTFPSLVASISSALESLDRKQNPQAFLGRFIEYLSPSLVTQVVNAQSDPHLAFRFFRWALSQAPAHYAPTPGCFVNIISRLLSHSLFSCAESLLDPDKHPSSVSDLILSKFIRAYGDLGDINGALYWFRAKARAFRVSRTCFSYNSVLAVLVCSNRIDQARAVFKQMLEDKSVCPDVSSYTTMIRGFCKSGRIGDARQLFDEMRLTRNLITYNTLIDGYCKKGFVEDARKVVDQMIVRGQPKPDTVTFTIMIDGYCKRGELDLALQFLEEMAMWSCKPNLGKINEAEKLLAKMLLNGIKPDVATHTNLLKGFCIVGRSDDAVRHLEEMIRMGIKPDVRSYEVIINEYCKMGRPKEAMNVLEQMKVQGLATNVSSFNAVLRALCQLGETDTAVHVLQQMPLQCTPPNSLSYSTVICNVCSHPGRMRDAEDLVVKMVRKGHSLDASIYSSLVQGYCESKDMGMAVDMFKEMLEKRFVINRESFSALVKNLCLDGKGNEAKRAFEEMCRRCHVPEVDLYRIVLDDHLIR
ncbi:hypothetical protein H6P81_002223 [Aristolochia fimbriata]|uniref:Pentatricopeptide repeat-containing protein n=1 Tax=Aristolochia fimbriata TaxID=158543 RepID=A0AAV7F970_ARIFI|nr:hypothetical protein H6P81_002223 [Aristolochia fimbriata]